jgi:CHASE3 domain sensor protein
MKTTLTTKLFTGIALLMALFAVVVVFSYRLAGQVLRNAQQVEASQHVSNEAVTLLRNIVDMETGFRGYLLIGNEQTLAPYYYGEREMVGRFLSLRDLVQDAAPVSAVERLLAPADCRKTRSSPAQPLAARNRRFAPPPLS